MTDEQINELLAKVTPGPWETQKGYVGASLRIFLVRPGCDGITFGHHYDTEIRARYDADAELAAVARTLIPELLQRAQKAETRFEEDFQDWTELYALRDLLRERRDRWRQRAEEAQAKLQEALQQAGKIMTNMHNQRLAERREHETELDGLRERVQSAEQARNQALQSLALLQEKNRELIAKLNELTGLAKTHAARGILVDADRLLEVLL